MVCKTDACGRSGRSSSSRSGSFSYDMNKQGLRRLYNSPVTKVESYSRPLGGFLGKAGLDHTGVVATTKDGGRYLIHKGSGYGKSSSTVVVDAKHMSNRWSKTGEKYTSGKTISDLMKDGYVNQKYGVGPNRKICWQSSKNIMDKSGRKKRRACR
ncbi:unnamed protein product [Mytilus coruscus]|uniref:Uncharacterized protein n=1 Tax=Mytilus coruscus TaxID=42192 RepID=A0A6J7ZVI7_MYTCO|nr:unnamed protein product [Mytilus coruscus]